MIGWCFDRLILRLTRGHRASAPEAFDGALALASIQACIQEDSAARWPRCERRARARERRAGCCEARFR